MLLLDGTEVILFQVVVAAEVGYSNSVDGTSPYDCDDTMEKSQLPRTA